MLTRRNFIGQSIRAAMIIGSGNILQSYAPGSFELPDIRNLKLRFALASDGHFGENNTDFQATHQAMIKWLNQEKKSRRLDFTVINGDLFHNKPELLTPVHETWSALSMPWYVSHGNHDRVDEEIWQQKFGYGWHHAFEQDDCGFIILNTADIAGKYVCPDLNFVEEQFKKFGDKKHVFVFMHITPIKWTKHGIDCPELTALFAQQKNLRCIFNGHDHDQDNVKTDRDKHYFFDSHIGGSWGTPYYGYRIVEITNNGNILTYQVNGGNSKMENKNIIKTQDTVKTA